MTLEYHGVLPKYSINPYPQQSSYYLVVSVPSYFSFHPYSLYGVSTVISYWVNGIPIWLTHMQCELSVSHDGHHGRPGWNSHNYGMGVLLCVNVNRCVHMFVSVCSLCVCVFVFGTPLC